MAEKSGEPMRSCFGYGELEKMLERHNFLIYEFLNRDEIQNRYFSECNNEMTAFEHINFAQAVLLKSENTDQSQKWAALLDSPELFCYVDQTLSSA